MNRVIYANYKEDGNETQGVRVKKISEKIKINCLPKRRYLPTKFTLSQPKTVIIIEVIISKRMSRGGIAPRTLNLGIIYCVEVNLFFNWGVGARAEFVVPQGGI
jgi:hypothetical protein